MDTHVAGQSLVLFHELLVLLVDLEDFADAVGGRFRLKDVDGRAQRSSSGEKEPIRVSGEPEGRGQDAAVSDWLRRAGLRDGLPSSCSQSSGNRKTRRS